MSEKIGPVSFKRGEEHVFLGRELGESSSISEHTAMLIDEEIRAMLDEGYQRALRILGESRDKLELLTRELLEKEVLTDREIYEVVEIPIPDALLDIIDNSDGSDDSKTATDTEENPSVSPDIDPGLLGLEGA
jgi:cell division protease FtsH